MVVVEVVLIVFDGGAIGAGLGSCGAGRGSIDAGVGASATLGSTEANLGVVNGSEGCREGVSNDPKKSKARGQYDEEFETSQRDTLVEFVDCALSMLDLESSSAASLASAFFPLRASAIISL